jgi:hypothetical protein
VVPVAPTQLEGNVCSVMGRAGTLGLQVAWPKSWMSRPRVAQLESWAPREEQLKSWASRGARLKQATMLLQRVRQSDHLGWWLNLLPLFLERFDHLGWRSDRLGSRSDRQPMFPGWYYRLGEWSDCQL